MNESRNTFENKKLHSKRHIIYHIDKMYAYFDYLVAW